MDSLHQSALQKTMSALSNESSINSYRSSSKLTSGLPTASLCLLKRPKKKQKIHYPSYA